VALVARIRTVKPEFFDDPDIIDLSLAARLLFIGLWTQADRRGRLLDEPRRLKIRLMPGDDVDVNAILNELVHAGVLVRYEVEGRKLLWIRNFERHQQPHVREAESVLAPCQHEAGPVLAPDKPRAGTPVTVTVSGSGNGVGKDAVASGRPPLYGKPLGYRPRIDCAWPGRPPVPGSLHAEFITKVGGDENEARAKLIAWYPTIAAQYADQPIGDDDFTFWKARFREWIGTTVKPVAPKQQGPSTSDLVADVTARLQARDAAKAGSR
jgi:translation initiation factor IF-1